jgi:hypothetical protein
MMKQAKHLIESHRYNSCTAKMPTSSPIDGSLAMAFGGRFQHG